MGGIPNTTAWPNVPLALSQGTFDGLVSTNMSCASGKLWEAGVKHAFEDHQFIGAYVPIISDTFWEKLDAGLQKTVTSVWEDNIVAYRKAMADAQVQSRKEMESHGVAFVDPTADYIATTPKAMMAEQDSMAKEIHLSPEIVQLVMHDLGMTT